MNYEVLYSSSFKRKLKQLSKKHTSLKNDLDELITALEKNPFQGTPIGQSCYKIRMPIASKGKGKSGGARVITHVYVTGTTVYLLAIFDKSEQETLSKQELKELLKEIKD